MDSGGIHQEKRLIVFNWRIVIDKDFDNFSSHFGFDFIEQLHRFDDADGIAHLCGITDIDKGLLVWGWSSIEGPDHWRFHSNVVVFFAVIGTHPSQKIVASDAFRDKMGALNYGVVWAGGEDFTEYLARRGEAFGAAISFLLMYLTFIVLWLRAGYASRHDDKMVM